MWVIAAALFIEGCIGIYYYAVVLKGSLASVETITEHSAPVHMNLVFVLAMTVWFFGGTVKQRWLLPVLCLPILFTYLATQRRAAFVGLLVALCLLALVLYQFKPQLFWLLAPMAAAVAVVYLAAFWNSSGALGTPARAVKAIFAPEQATLRDQLSNAYRVIENINTQFTIQQAPLTGVGFGRKFSILVPMPDISFFEWWEYITHNSILWIWMKTGVLGFLSLLLLIGTSVVTGVRAFARMPSGELQAITLSAVLYLVMHFVYAYVDMSWDGQSMILVGAMLGLLGSVEAIVAQPAEAPAKH
jgi:O-antigen ligase